MNIGGPELVLIAIVWVIPILVLYWIIRLGVRHGARDAQRRES